MSGTATFMDWLTAYQEVYESPERLAARSCPNCGSRGLHLVLVVRQQSDPLGWAAFWCGHCMTGVALDRAEVRPGMRVFASGPDPQSTSEVIPSYRLIPPSPTVSDRE